MKPIYEPTGKAKEYGDYALNIYTGCPHRCYYCFAPNVLHKQKEQFWSVVNPRPNIVEETRKQLQREKITGKTIHICFTCDPYPTGYDTTTTREIIKAIKESGNHVQILTKGNGMRDFDLLDEMDWYGITLDGSGCGEENRLWQIVKAKIQGIKTWISFEPVLDDLTVLTMLENVCKYGWADKVKIGKLNYHPSIIDWNRFGTEAERICKKYGMDYYIKESLRKELRSTYEQPIS